jgi:galactonate dehydratase
MKIISVESFPIRLPRDLDAAQGTAGTPNALRAGEGDYRWSKDYPCLYPVHIETALVRVTLDNGMYGWGEAQAPLAPEVACTIVDRLLRPILAGQEFDGANARVEELWQLMYASMRVRGQTGGFMMDAIAGVDIALWDLAGKLRGKPVAALLNDQPRASVPAYLSGVAGDSLKARIQYAHRFHKQGFRIFKIYLESDWDAALVLADELQAQLGPGTEVAIDALWHLDPGEARKADGHRLLWLECPFMPESPEMHKALAESIRTPVAIGESYRTRYELAPFVAARAMRYVQPDLGRVGITEAMRIARVAQDHQMKIVPHVSIAMGPQIAAAIHFAAAAPACDLCEYNPKVLEVANRFLGNPITLDGAAYRVPEAPGLGIEVRLPG